MSAAISLPAFALAVNEQSYFLQREKTALSAKTKAQDQWDGGVKLNSRIRNEVAKASGGATLASPADFWVEQPGVYHLIVSNGMGCEVIADVKIVVSCY